MNSGPGSDVTGTGPLLNDLSLSGEEEAGTQERAALIADISQAIER